MDTLILGDSSKELIKLQPNSIDLIVTDPPYGYSFMGKNWDKAVPSVEVWKGALSALKPGAFMFVMSAPRQDVLSQMIVRITEAGFDTNFTSIYWTYASGFPKAMNIGKRGGPDGAYGGFQPKPAVEVIIIAMKPLSEKTFIDQALKNGKGVTWLDDCRIPTSETLSIGSNKHDEGVINFGMKDNKALQTQDSRGRFPANLLVSDDVLGEYSRYFNLDTMPFVITPKASKREKNEGLESFPIKTLKHLSGGDYGDNPNRDDVYKNGTPTKNAHPTVKPLKLMSYLITLGSREGDVVLDPFLGSGTTALAAKQLNRRYIGIEREKEYLDIAQARLNTIQLSLLEIKD